MLQVCGLTVDCTYDIYSCVNLCILYISNNFRRFRCFLTRPLSFPVRGFGDCWKFPNRSEAKPQLPSILGPLKSVKNICKPSYAWTCLTTNGDVFDDCLFLLFISIVYLCLRDFVRVKALLEWVREYAVRAYTTADSAVSYLIHAQIAWTTPSFALWRMTAAAVRWKQLYQCELSAV